MLLILVLQLIGSGMSLLINVDPNPENFVCAGIIKATSVQIGTLVRLEPNRQAQVKTTYFTMTYRRLIIVPCQVNSLLTCTISWL